MSVKIDKNSYKYEEVELHYSYALGVTLAVSSALFIGGSFVLKKLSLLRLSKSNSVRASAGGFGYLKDWIWWSGFISMGFGELLNLIAYGFAPASLVTPLGALSVLVSTVLASKFLQEHLTASGKVGCLLCVFGSVVIILNGPKEVDSSTTLSIEHLQRAPVIFYSILVLFSTFILICFIGPKYGNRFISVYIILCSQVGSFTVVASKTFVMSIKEKLHGIDNGYHLIFMSFSVLLICVSIQITYLNKALDIFGTTVVTPIYYVIFTTLTLLFSAILFDEWKEMTFLNTAGTLVGLFIAFTAIYLLHSKKEKMKSDCVNVLKCNF